MTDLNTNKTIWTIGHSTHSQDVFLDMLKSFNIELLADVRRYPGSRRYPHFNAEPLATWLAAEGVSYTHFPELGGRRKPREDSINLAWRHTAFRGYADHLETAEFQAAIKELCAQAMEKRTAYMCSEAPWWRCHRSIISDYLKAEGWNVMHIMKADKAAPHPYTTAASIINGRLDYSGNSLRFQ